MLYINDLIYFWYAIEKKRHYLIFIMYKDTKLEKIYFIND